MNIATTLLRLTWKSLLNRRLVIGLTILSITMSVVLVTGVEKLRTDAREGFTNTISGTDLIVGARSGSVQLLLYSVFRIGNATNNISWESYQNIAARPEVEWTIPLSLGDSHRGFRVVGTTGAYFEHFRYADKRPLAFRTGRAFNGVFETVIGAEVAEALGYAIGDKITVAHGIGKIGLEEHADNPFTVIGILARTGTPVDRSVHVSLKGIEAIHVGWDKTSGSSILGLGKRTNGNMATLTPKSITAFMVGLKSRLDAFRVLRAINEDPREPLLAILPGVALQELWGVMRTAETGLAAISSLVVAAGLIGMLTMLLAGMNERRREMAILRAVGARPAHIFTLFLIESAAIVTLAIGLGLATLYGVIYLARDAIETAYGLHIPLSTMGPEAATYLTAIAIAGLLAGAIPAIIAYRYSVIDGMTVRR